MTINIPDYVKKIMHTLQTNGFEAFVVGGAVRDAVLGESPDDWDVTTNAMVEDVQNCFERHFDTGIKHGTVTVLMEGRPVEVTTYRIDGEYTDNRRPQSVCFTKSLAEDLKRRDFTINAMAYNDTDGMVDLYGGMEDLKNKIIRCVGNPDKRFTEDALRIMRAVRFSVSLGFEIEKKTLDAIKNKRELLENISAERIQVELVKTLMSNNDTQILFDSGIMQVILPELKNNSSIILKMPADVELKLSAMLYGTDLDTCRNILNRLKFDNKTKNNVIKILEGSMEPLEENDYVVRRFINKYGRELTPKVFEFLKKIEKNTAKIEKIYKKNEKYPLVFSELAVSGNDLVSLGYNGREVGEMLKILMKEVLKAPENNAKEALLNIAKSKKHQ